MSGRKQGHVALHLSWYFNYIKIVKSQPSDFCCKNTNTIQKADLIVVFFFLNQQFSVIRVKSYFLRKYLVWHIVVCQDI